MYSVTNPFSEELSCLELLSPSPTPQDTVLCPALPSTPESALWSPVLSHCEPPASSPVCSLLLSPQTPELPSKTSPAICLNLPTALTHLWDMAPISSPAPFLVIYCLEPVEGRAPPSRASLWVR
jgi:hypothetical protein